MDMKVRIETTIQLGRLERTVLRVGMWRVETKRNGLITVSFSLNLYSFTVNKEFVSKHLLFSCCSF